MLIILIQKLLLVLIYEEILLTLQEKGDELIKFQSQTLLNHSLPTIGKRTACKMCSLFWFPENPQCQSRVEKINFSGKEVT